MDRIKGAAVVITGASSGIGRTAALAFARRGARLALAARRADVLDEVVRECERLGARAIAVPTDVTDPAAMAALAERTAAAFGRIDVWINNAGTGVVGAFADSPLELSRRTVETNLFGAMNGAHAVLPVFRRQRSGTLINNISMGGWAPIPFGAAYSASKFGLRAFTAALRQELAEEPGIRVCGVFPAMVDTPGIQHGANQTGRKLNLGPLVYTPQDVADTFLRVVENPRDEVAVGWPGLVAKLTYGIAPWLTEHLSGAALRRALASAKPAPKTEGNLLAPIPQGATEQGDWLQSKGLPPARQMNALALGALLLAGLAVAALRQPAIGPRRRV